MSKQLTGIQELKKVLVDECSKNNILKDLTEVDVNNIVDILLKEQFSRTDKLVQSGLSETLQRVVDRLLGEK